MSIGRINRPGASSGEQAHAEGLAPELEPGQWIHGGCIWRTDWIPAAGGGFWAMPVMVRRIVPLRLSAEQQMLMAARYLHSRGGAWRS